MAKRSTGLRVLGTTVAAVGIVAGAIAVVTAVATAFATVVFARKVVTPQAKRDDDVRIVGVDLAAGRITLAASDESRMHGRYGLWFEGDSGHARLADVDEERGGVVIRGIDAVDYGRLDRARRGRIDGWYFLGPWELDLPYRDVVVQTPLGPAPAWSVPAAAPTDRWVVQVHGRGAKRHEALRAVPPVHEAGWNSLLISYRNDGEAPESADRRYGLGGTEWEDVVAAVRFATARGAREIVLMGWSMGGMIALQAVLRSEEAREHLVGVVLDSPAVDWVDILRFQGTALGLPAGLGDLVAGVLGAPVGVGLTGAAAPIDLVALDLVARSGELATPMLLMHSTDDGFVPIDGSRRLAASRPDLVQFEEFTGARHTKLWNHDPERWTRLITAWLATRSGGAPADAAGEGDAEIVG
ncbi:alpha/beta hydrolase [Agromyces endophyticus]|uniref:alpha/beta hydrolase family protein n=1 Tax=Agromyces sp. H17E-10 TaxID=2932244 RepID=UPI001FD0B1B7|nr:alpha/beta fold hydrolase [Agromyces sp. H17E-10]UOQ88975.1 alpha/beta hydrolase [Agromyces sp. H17E-10]